MSNARILNFILAGLILFLIIKIIGADRVLQDGQQDPYVSNSKSTIETIHQRKSVRQFSPQEVSEEDLIELVRAGMAAPTARNQQPWTFIIINDKAKLEALGEALPTAKSLIMATAAIAVCGDLDRALTETSRDYWVQDCSAASQNILLAAESMGLGSVWTAVFPYDERIAITRKALELPENIIPLNVIPIGYPAGEEQPKDKWKPENVRVNTFNNKLTHYADSRILSDHDVNTTHQAWVSLTVAESKRLIAKGLKAYPPFADRLKNGQVLVTKGTTNSYIVEEIINDSLHPGEYILGHILPEEGNIKIDQSNPRAELILKDGVIQDIPYARALDAMNPGDIVLKGANIINHEKGQAGVLIGHPTGGTTGVIMPKIIEHNLRLIIPVGLEKASGQDIDLLSRYSKIPHEAIGEKMPWVWSLQGELFTELEAIKQFADVEATHLASGGIGGAEGAVTICLRGEHGEVEKALGKIREIQGESPYIK